MLIGIVCYRRRLCPIGAMLYWSQIVVCHSVCRGVVFLRMICDFVAAAVDSLPCYYCETHLYYHHLSAVASTIDPLPKPHSHLNNVSLKLVHISKQTSQCCILCAICRVVSVANDCCRCHLLAVAADVGWFAL